jgi:hypothetical protein
MTKDPHSSYYTSKTCIGVCYQKDAPHDNDFCSDECRQKTIERTIEQMDDLQKFLQKISQK